MPVILWVAVGGALGSALRYLVNVNSLRLFGAEFPWHTLIVNIAGCFAMGVIIEASALKFQMSNEVRAFLTTGILGGFTTFSAFSLDFAVLVERKAYGLAGAYAASSVIVSLLAVFSGLYVVRAVLA